MKRPLWPLLVKGPSLLLFDPQGPALWSVGKDQQNRPLIFLWSIWTVNFSS